MRHRTVLLACALGAMFSGCAASAPSAPPARRVMTLERLYYDNAGAVQDTVQLIIREPAVFEEQWRTATASNPFPPQAPSVDFSSRLVVLVAAGRLRPGAGIRVDSAQVGERQTAEAGSFESTIVFVRVTEGCPGIEDWSYPMEIVAIPRYTDAFEFQRVRETNPDCMR